MKQYTTQRVKAQSISSPQATRLFLGENQCGQNFNSHNGRKSKVSDPIFPLLGGSKTHVFSEAQ